VLYASPYAIHGGRINLATFAGNVESVSVDDHWNNYFYYYYGDRAMLPGRWLDANGQPMNPSH